MKELSEEWRKIFENQFDIKPDTLLHKFDPLFSRPLVYEYCGKYFWRLSYQKERHILLVNKLNHDIL
jgi:hypothetical protein